MHRKAVSNHKVSPGYGACIKAPFAYLGLRFENDYLVGIDFLDSQVTVSDQSYAARKLSEQLSEYLALRNKIKTFNVKLKLNGTPFQNKVWRALSEIPAGNVMTYGQLAKQLHTSPRAIGNACRKNPIPVVIPCHRVVSKTNIGGFFGQKQGEWINIKKWLLDHEGIQLQ